jgi:intracellular multiplication protein IcmB
MSIGYTISSWISKVLKNNVMNYCQIETSSGKNNLVTREGGLMSIYEIKGTFGIVGENAFLQQLESMVNGLSSGLSRPGHRLQFIFRRDPMNSKEALRKSIRGAIQTMTKLNLDLEGMITERGSLLERKTVLETCHLVITTYPSALHPDILKESGKERAANSLKNGSLKPGAMAQSPNMEMPGLEMIHSGFATQVISKLQEKISIGEMDAHQFVHLIKKQITQFDTSDQWKATLFGDQSPSNRLVEEVPAAGDLSHLLWPEVSHQLFTREPKTHEKDSTLVDIGDWVIAPLMVDQRPQDPKPFADLFGSIDRNVPWQMSLVIDSGHERIKSMISKRKTFASFVAFASSENALIRDAAEILLQAATDNTLVSGQITFSTWGRSLEDTRRNRSKLKSAVEAWGQLQIIEERGDAIEAWFNTLPGFSANHLATPIPFTVTEALGLAPLTRPVSPWADGTMLYRTIDEKVFPYLPGSNLQNANMELVFAPPGFGKSFYLAAANMGLITRPGNEILPRIGILDIGFSSAMFVDMVRDALPANQKHLAQSFRLEMDRRYAVNFFDTPLGCQIPLKVDREFVVNMMTLLCTPAGKEAPGRLSELVSNLVDAMYEYFSEEKNPNIYERGLVPKVDEAIEAHNLKLHDGVSWWKLVRILHLKGLSHEATLAQRFAVPTLNDATAVLARSSSIKDVYGESMVDNGQESLIKYLQTMITSSVNDFPILSQPTVFSLGEARIVSIDLMSVARDGSAQAEKKTAVMYLLGRQILSKDFYRKAIYTIPEIPEEYKSYHRKIIERDEAVPKKFCMDEFHRTSAVPAVRKQAAIDIREGRKYDVHVSLLSQLLEDFDDSMVKLVNNIIILSKGISEMSLNEIRARFAPSEDAIKYMNRWLTGPGPEGSSMLYIGQLTSETAPKIEQVLRLTLGPTEIWAYSTTPTDVSLRKRMSDRIGLSNALKVLSKAYPKGSAKADIQKILAENAADLESGDEDLNLFDVLVDRLIKEHPDLIDPAKISVAG